MSLETAETRFPIESWLSKYVRVYSSKAVVYADCYVCRGKKKLGVIRQSKKTGDPLVVCGRCREGGHGGGVWRGASSITGFVALVEGIPFKQAAEFVHRLSGVANEWRPPEDTRTPGVPEDAVPLLKCSSSNLGVLLLRNRYCDGLIGSSYFGVSKPYVNRVIIPCYYREQYLGFEAKATFKGGLKSIYAPNMDTDVYVHTPIWNEGRGDLVITESVIDAETFRLLNVDAIGCFGGFKSGQVMRVLELNPKRVFWFLDGDTWGKIWPSISLLLPFVENFLPPMQERDDPNALGPVELQRRILDAEKIQTKLDLMQMKMKVRGW